MAAHWDQLQAQLEASWQALAEEQRQLEALAQQTRMQVERESQRFALVRAKLDTLDRTLDRYSREELRQLFQVAKEREVFLATLRAELEGLEYKRTALAAQRRTIGRLAALVRGENPGEDDVPATWPAAVAGTDDPGPPGAQAVAPAADLGALLLAQEVDRSRLALMLHDRVAQPLHNLVLQTEVLPRAFKADPAAAYAELEGLRETATRVLGAARQVIFALRPMSLDDLGLLPTLDRYVQVRAEQDQLTTRLRKQGRPRPLSPTVETAIYRIVEAALDNVRDHAGVKEAEMLLVFTEGEVRLTIADWGRGCDLSQTQACAGGSGLAVMRERARQIGGTIEFDSAPGRGMTVRLSVPLTTAGEGRRASGAWSR